MPTPPFDDQTAIAGMPGNRIHWVKSPLVTRMSFYRFIQSPYDLIVYYDMVFSNPSNNAAQVADMPMPEGPLLRIRSEGRDILPIPSDRPTGVKAPPRDDEIRRRTFDAPAGWVSRILRDEFALNGYQLLPGTHIYELVYWQSHMNWLNVRDGIRSTDTGKGNLRYPATDNAPSNRIYIKVYAPTEEEARQGKTIQFLGEVDAATQVPRFPYVRPGDFATKTGKWRPIGPSIDELGGGPYEVNVQRGDQMPNLPGDKGVDPFSFLWQFDPDSKDQVSFEDSLKAVKPGQVCPKSGLYEPIKPGQDHYAFTLRTNPDRYRQFKEGDVMPGYFANDEHNADLTWKWLRPPGVYGW